MIKYISKCNIFLCVKNNIFNIIELYENEFKYTIKYTRTRNIRNIDLRESTYITIRRIINVCINNSINTDLFINITPFTSEKIIDGYVNYIKAVYAIADENNNLNEVDTTNLNTSIESYDYMFNKAYQIWKNVEFLNYYNYTSNGDGNDNLLTNNDKTIDAYLKTIMEYYNVLVKILETRIIDHGEYMFIYNFMDSLIQKYGYRQELILLLLLLELIAID